ncbi:MAG TPA: hypothetical protein VJX68_08470, partial [Candidatus Binatus sp.]|uniref:hypothetical protein n=1 Tax=Candidatus Binatus sp. TaxID=2811406 RepID=UPI002B478E63
ITVSPFSDDGFNFRLYTISILEERSLRDREASAVTEPLIRFDSAKFGKAEQFDFYPSLHHSGMHTLSSMQDQIWR